MGNGKPPIKWSKDSNIKWKTKIPGAGHATPIVWGDTIFVQTAVPIEIGMRCALVFPLPGRDGKVHVIGRVVRTVPPQFTDDRESMRVPGMGVEFERFGGPNDRHSIEAFLHRHESETLRPEVGPLSFPE
jgi:Tfp pilus assembly protein PilZ